MAAYGGGDSFWDIVWSAEWAATVGLPLGVTLGSLRVAYVLVRRQIRHDRELAAAQRRADAASRLGAALIDVQRGFDAPPSDPRWAEARWPDWTAVSRAVSEAAVVLDEEEAFEYARQVSRCISWGWRSCQRRRADLAEARNAPAALDFAEALAETLQPHAHRLYELGKHLTRWDGYGPLSVAGLAEFERVPPRRRKPEEHREWCDGVAAEFEELAEAARLRRVRVRPRRRR